MQSIVMGLLILSVASTPQIFGQEPLHLSGGSERANVSLVADSMERQDPPNTSASPYASVVRLKGNVLIRTCCVQRGTAKNRPKQVMILRADEVEYHQESGEIEARGVVKVTFQNYPK